MRLALAEARKGVGKTHPNPAVGAIVVKSGRVLARGWHRAAGQPHAEVEAMRALGALSAKGATIYVTLEPCSTHGRTPPCTDAILHAGLSRVVYGATDPNPNHAGRASKILKTAGIKVANGVLEKECSALNAAWNKWIATGLPYVIAKAGMTLDGRIGSPPDSRWITNEASRRDTMKIRAASQAILVGGETVRVDDPQLTVRGKAVKIQPLRAIWTQSGRLPRGAKVFHDEYKDRTIILKDMSLKAALRELGKRGVAQVLIEGGARVLGEAFDRGLVDEVYFYMAAMISGGAVPTTGGRGVPSSDKGITLAEVTYRRFGHDVRMHGKVAA